MKWHEYPDEIPYHGTICLIKIEKPRLDREEFAIVKYNRDKYYWNRYINGYIEGEENHEYDPCEYPFWIYLEGDEEE